MAVRIRLRRMGRKKKPHYRIVVTDRTSPRDGRFVESIGYYKPLATPARLVLDLDRTDYWLAHGAEPSNTVGSLIRKARVGGDATVAVGPEDPERVRAEKAEEIAGKRKAEAEAARAAAESEAAEAKAEAAAAAQAEAPAESGVSDEAVQDEGATPAAKDEA